METDEWVNPDDCGEFPCSALLNVVIRVEGATNTNGAWNGWSGLFTIISEKSVFPDFETHLGDTIAACALNSDWNAYYCDNENDMGLLLFENTDDDAWDRAIQPVHMKNYDLSNFDNILNAFRDDCEDGFYTC